MMKRALLDRRKKCRFMQQTILAVRKNGKLAIAGDGQVTLGHTVFKSTARKIRKN